MKNVKQIIFTLAMVIGLALSVSAQKGGNDPKRPPKDSPTIDPRPKDRPPRGNPPKEDKPKKPGMSFFLVSSKYESDLG